MINNSKLLILINREFEWFLKDILESKKNEIKLLELSNYDQIKFLESTHAHHEEKEHHEEDDHYEEDDEHYDHEAMIDFHIWLSPTNALAIGEIITIKLSEIDPENKFFYLDNLLVFEKKILALNTKIRKMFNKKKIANYIVLHDAYQYFEDEFEIENEIAIKFDSHQENTIKDIIEIRKILRDKDIKCIFSDGVSDKKLLNILNKDFDLKIIELDHLGDNFDKNKSLYFKLIESLANSFLECR